MVNVQKQIEDQPFQYAALPTGDVSTELILPYWICTEEQHAYNKSHQGIT